MMKLLLHASYLTKMLMTKIPFRTVQTMVTSLQCLFMRWTQSTNRKTLSILGKKKIQKTFLMKVIRMMKQIKSSHITVPLLMSTMKMISMKLPSKNKKQKTMLLLEFTTLDSKFLVTLTWLKSKRLSKLNRKS